VFGIVPQLFVGSILPRVEDPWPDTIGLGFPFAIAGAIGVLASVVYADAEEDRRDRAIRAGGLMGFRIGAAIYVISLVIQVGFVP
jgi:hypothetical protein